MIARLVAGFLITVLRVLGWILAFALAALVGGLAAFVLLVIGLALLGGEQSPTTTFVVVAIAWAVGFAFVRSWIRTQRQIAHGSARRFFPWFGF